MTGFVVFLLVYTGPRALDYMTMRLADIFFRSFANGATALMPGDTPRQTTVP